MKQPVFSVRFYFEASRKPDSYKNIWYQGIYPVISNSLLRRRGKPLRLQDIYGMDAVVSKQ